MIYPQEMIVNGHIYKIDTNYQTALACYRAINDKDISDTERALAIITLLLGKDVPVEDWVECAKKCAIYLRCGKEDNDNVEEADMDYFQDESVIRTSIRQCYHINLNVEKDIHWWEYNELIEGLTEETELSKIREIRNYDLSKEKDPKIRERIQKAKDKYKLRRDVKEKTLTTEQEKNIDNFYKLMGIERE